MLDNHGVGGVGFGVAIFSSPGQSPGRAIVLPPVLVLAVALAKC